jgi:NAD(P)-dependent dehydrogenase (short-subunit alcohol dehydrogenase family)
MDVNSSKLDEAADECRRLGAEVRAACIDVSQYESVKSFVAEFVHEFGKISSVFLNAGLGPSQVSYDLMGFRQLMETNYFGTVNTVQSVLSVTGVGQESEDKLHFVHSGSFSKRVSTHGSGGYSASKAASSRYLESLQLQLSGTNVHIVDVEIGFVYTPMTENVDHAGNLMEYDVEWVAQRIARERFSSRLSRSIPFYRNLIWRLLEEMPSRARFRILKFAFTIKTSNSQSKQIDF